MKNDDLGYPGLIPNGPRLRQEVAKALSHLEIQRDLVPAVVPTEAVKLRAFFVEAIAYLDAHTGTTA